MFTPRFGISLHSISKTPAPDILSALIDAGVETLELYAPLFDNDPAKALKALPEPFRSRIPVASVHLEFGTTDISSPDKAMRERSIASAIKGVEMASALEASLAVVHASGEPVVPEERDSRMRFARESMDAIIERACKPSGIRLAIESLPRSCLGNTVEELEVLIEGFPEGVAGICIDSNHLMDRYESLPGMVRRVGKRLVATHVSDYDGVDEKHWLPGKGVIDWRAFMKALSATGYAGPFNYECGFPQELPELERLALLKKSHESLSRVFKGL